MKEVLTELYNNGTLDRSRAQELLCRIGNGEINDAQIAAFISVYLMRLPTIDELSGFREAMLALAVPCPLSDYDPIDIVGTGGDGKNTFNISTLSCLVVAACGYKVAKHGNYGATSVSGSSTVLEQLGYHFTADPDILRERMERHAIVFLHAPQFHPAMKKVAPVRKALGVRTFFNLLGPLINPVQPNRMVLGISHQQYALLYKYMMQQMGVTAFAIIHSPDGYDEISLTGDFEVITARKQQLLRPVDIGFRSINPSELHAGNTPEEAADVFLKIAAGHGTEAQENVVVTNTAIALQCCNPAISFADGMLMAREALTSGKVKRLLAAIMDGR